MTAPAFADNEDPRSYNHGINAVPDGEGGYRVFFSSSGLVPTGEDEDGNWTHDIYMGRWTPGMARLNPSLFLGKPEAQEPVDVARSEDGHILMTLEDGWDTYGEVEQRYAVYDAHMHVVVAYPQTVSDGGHSGHVAAVGNRFIIFYSDGWIKGGGADDLGSGDGVYARIYNSRGQPLRFVPVGTRKREWWPLIAGGKKHALLLWQAYVKGQTYTTLKFSLLDPTTGQFSAPQVLRDGVQYYTYAVQYVTSLDRFIVTGTGRTGRGFAYVLDDKGLITARLDCMPATVREAGLTIMGVEAFTPTADNRLMDLQVGISSLILHGLLPSPLRWSTVGSLGLPSGAGRLHWFSLDKSGLQEAEFDVRTSTPPSPQDQCQ